MGALLGILFFGIIQGILIGVVLSLLLLIARASKPAVRRLGRDPTTDVYVNVDRYDGLELVPGLLVLRIDGPLFFADAGRFRDALNELIKSNPEPVRAIVVERTRSPRPTPTGPTSSSRSSASCVRKGSGWPSPT
jgi:sulfate permease, SulP family